MNVLSLFSGIGGLDLGLERAGFAIAGQVEIDPWCRKVLAKHWPEVPRHDDVRTAAEWWGGRRAPDLVCGGFPCQPVSVAGLGLAQADERWLWPAFAGIIRDLRPRYVFVENVPGLLGRGMGDVLGDLASLGYDAEWDCLSAADFGAPHLRKRIWIVAYARCQGREPGGLRRGPAPTRKVVDLGLADGSPCPPAMADATGERREQREGLRGTWRHSAVWRQAGDLVGNPLGWPPIARGELHHWVTEPDVGRVAHGVPGRVDRLRGLGNAVVPQVVEHIGRMILAAEAAAS